MIYSKTQIELLTLSLEGNIKAFKELLKQSHNLAALEGAIRGEPKAIEHDAILAIFLNATEGNKSAIRFLINKKELVLAATANLVKGDDKAAEWLHRFGYEHYIELAEAIKNAYSRNTGLII